MVARASFKPGASKHFEPGLLLLYFLYLTLVYYLQAQYKEKEDKNKKVLIQVKERIQQLTGKQMFIFYISSTLWLFLKWIPTLITAKFTVLHPSLHIFGEGGKSEEANKKYCGMRVREQH